MLAMPCRKLFSLSLLCRTTLSNKSYRPHLGQGVAQAVEDAIAITTVLSLIKSKQQLPEALQAYEMSRKTRVLEMQAATRQAQQFAYRKDGELKATRNKEEEDALEAKKSDDLIKMMRSSWAYDAAEQAASAYWSSKALGGLKG
jgi:salicylate hydroxylase